MIETEVKDMEYTPLKMERVIKIEKLYSLHYFQFAAGYIFPGEKHNFWEMVYIDRGEADIGAGRQVVRLRQGQAIFHRPNEFHSIWANSATGPNIMVLSFGCTGNILRTLAGQALTLDAQMRGILRQLIAEGQECFGKVLDISGQRVLTPVENAPLGSQQMILLLLEQILLLLLRQAREGQEAGKQEAPHLTEERNAADITNQLTALMREHLDGSLSFEEICRQSGLSQTALKACFRRYNRMGVMEYYQRLRIEEARRLLREGRLNVTQTAEALGYSSIHAFSRQFKRLMGVTPLSYLRTIKE